MSEIMDRLVEKRVHECCVDMTKRMIADGTLTLEKIVKYSGLSIEEVKRLAEESTDSHSV